MDPRHIDHLARLLGHRPSRRAAFAVLAGALGRLSIARRGGRCSAATGVPASRRALRPGTWAGLLSRHHLPGRALCLPAGQTALWRSLHPGQPLLQHHVQRRGGLPQRALRLPGDDEALPGAVHLAGLVLRPQGVWGVRPVPWWPLPAAHVPGRPGMPGRTLCLHRRHVHLHRRHVRRLLRRADLPGGNDPHPLQGAGTGL